MGEVEKFDVWRQRVALMEISELGAEFLNTGEGAAFLEQLDHHIAPQLVSFSRDGGGDWCYHLERQDVVNMIVVRLLSAHADRPEKSPARYAAAADDPWGYLFTCAVRWVREERGVRGIVPETPEMLAIPHPDGSPSDLTPLEDVVSLTFEQLRSRTPEEHHAAVYELLGWLAANPPQRLSYEGFEKRDAHRYCPTLTVQQVSAVMHIAWGGRPRRAESSLMGQYLKNPDFRPSDSPSHARALTFFKNAFRAGESGGRMLSDWKVA